MTNRRPEKQWLQGRKLAIVAVLSVVLLMMTGFVWKKNTVYIVADGQEYTVQTHDQNPRSIIRDAGVRLGARDVITSSTKGMENGTVLTVTRIVPVQLTYQGKTKLIHTDKTTVEGAAASVGLAAPQVKTFPSADTQITPGMEIKVVDYRETIVERKTDVPYNVVRQPDATMEKGMEEVVQHGSNGQATLTVRQMYYDGQPAGEEIVNTDLHVAPTDKIVRTGMRDTVSTSRGDMRFSRSYYMEATAYLPTDGSGTCITATGVRAQHGVVAVDPDVIPLGSRVYIPGYGVALAADTGGAIVGNRIDLCMESYGDAMSFGRRSVKVYILE